MKRVSTTGGAGKTPEEREREKTRVKPTTLQRPRGTPRRSCPPWYRRPCGRGEPAADLKGKPASGSTFRRGGRVVFAAEVWDPFDAPAETPPEASRLYELKRRVSKVLSQYRRSKMFSPFEMELMESLFSGMSMSDFGRRHSMTRQATEYHVLRIMSRAPLFKRFWRTKNMMRYRA